MSTDLDTRARRAATGLIEAVGSAELRSQPPGSSRTRHRSRLALRPALVAALLVIGSAVGVALVLDSTPVPDTTPPPSTPSTAPNPTVATTAPYVPPTTSVGVAPVAPPTTESEDSTAPALTITHPSEGSTVDEKMITFTGMTEPGARVFAGRYEAEVASSGEWHILLVLSEGANLARFTAEDAAGNEASATVTVNYAPPTPVTTTEPKGETPTTAKEELAEFSASATYGSCTETPPFDVYYGTGQPGSTVFVTSEHGSGSVEVGPEGQWQVEVTFTTAPAGVIFPVKVSDEFGRKVTLEFVYTP